MRFDKSNTPFNLSADVAEIIKTLRKGNKNRVRKISQFEAHIRTKPNTRVSNIATTNSPNNSIGKMQNTCLE